MRIRSAILVICLLGVTATDLRAADEVTEKNWQKIRKAVLPDKADNQWRKVPWRATLWDAVVDAQRADKPILLWAMNGHALACT
jgi:hypothetical protein